jgi:hypothetical protein
MVQELARRTAAEIFAAFEAYNQTFRAVAGSSSGPGSTVSVMRLRE